MREFMIPRRLWLQQSACGFGSVAAAAMFGQTAHARSVTASSAAGHTGVHHLPKASRMIFLFMFGGVSQVDSFDYKPALTQRHGDTMSFNDARLLAKTGKETEQQLMKSPWRFRQHGQSGRWVSDLFPKTAEHVDDLCFLHAMHTEGVAHGPATLFLHCGSTSMIRPSMGSWVYYGLGTENNNLPGFVSIAPSPGNGGARKYGTAFLPPKFQGTRLVSDNADRFTIDSLVREQASLSDVAQQTDILQRLNRQQYARRHQPDAELEAAVESYDLAWRMQRTAPEILDLSTETAATQQMYGLDDPRTRDYGQKCLLARRLCESGVRFIEVNYGGDGSNWDQHSDIPKHLDHASAVDRPVSALLHDLKQRGLLEDTIVWFGSEFGRTPYSQGRGTGRDHNPGGFTAWLAGGGFRPGFAYGETDEFGFQGVNGRVHMHDLHATLLHQLGLDHKQLTFGHAGREFRLTDVHGHVVHDIIS